MDFTPRKPTKSQDEGQAKVNYVVSAPIEIIIPASFFDRKTNEEEKVEPHDDDDVLDEISSISSCSTFSVELDDEDLKMPSQKQEPPKAGSKDRLRPHQQRRRRLMSNNQSTLPSRRKSFGGVGVAQRMDQRWQSTPISGDSTLSICHTHDRSTKSPRCPVRSNSKRSGFNDDDDDDKCRWKSWSSTANTTTTCRNKCSINSNTMPRVPRRSSSGGDGCCWIQNSRFIVTN